MKQFLIVLALLGSFSYASAADTLSSQAADRHHSISLRWGYGYLSRQDLIFSPLVHSGGSALNLGLRYRHEAKLVQWVNFSAGLNHAAYRSGNASSRTHTFYLVELDYAIGKTWIRREKSALAAGVILQNDVQAGSYNYGVSGALGYFSSNNLGAWARYRRFWKSETLDISAQLPLVSWMARSPYLINDDEYIRDIASHNGVKTFLGFVEGGKIYSPLGLQQVKLSLDYRHHFGPKFMMGAEAQWSFLHSASPLNLLSYRTVLYLNAAYQF